MLIVVIGIALAMLVIERMVPARPWPVVRGWWPRALAANGFQIVAVVVAGATWERWLNHAHLLSLAELPRFAELAIGYAVYVLWLYWSHRGRHHFDVLWRWIHRFHHGPARIEVVTAFYKHPFEIVGESITSSVLLYVVLGVSRESAFIIANVSGILGLFYHWNIATPRWLGYLVQRPESHCVHHQRGVHAFNYSELPIVDMMFGTFRNPPVFSGECGLGDDQDPHQRPDGPSQR